MPMFSACGHRCSFFLFFPDILIEIMVLLYISRSRKPHEASKG